MLCDPCREIPEGAANIHGITNAHVTGHPDCFMAVWVFTRLLLRPDACVICGFNNSTYDTVMIDSIAGAMGLAKIKDNYDQIDVLDLIYRYLPTLENKKLGAVYEYLFNKPLIGAHGAVQDCIATYEILLYLCNWAGRTPEDFVNELKTPIVYSTMPIGKYMGRSVYHVPVSWARYMRSNATDMRPDLAATVDWVLRRG